MKDMVTDRMPREYTAYIIDNWNEIRDECVVVRFKPTCFEQVLDSLKLYKWCGNHSFRFCKRTGIKNWLKDNDYVVDNIEKRISNIEDEHRDIKWKLGLD